MADVAVGNVNTRSLILQHLYEHQRASAFTRYTIPNNLINKVAETTSETDALTSASSPQATADKANKATPINVFGVDHVATTFQPNGFYYEIHLDFALGRQTGWIPTGLRMSNSPRPAMTAEEARNWGRGFGNPLVNPKHDAIYICRARVSQLRVDPMVGGFYLDWVIPDGWLFADGHPSALYVEASSNPIVIQRKFLSPETGKIPAAVFRVLVLNKYL